MKWWAGTIWTVCIGFWNLNTQLPYVIGPYEEDIIYQSFLKAEVKSTHFGFKSRFTWKKGQFFCPCVRCVEWSEPQARISAAILLVHHTASCRQRLKNRVFKYSSHVTDRDVLAPTRGHYTIPFTLMSLLFNDRDPAKRPRLYYANERHSARRPLPRISPFSPRVDRGFEIASATAISRSCGRPFFKSSLNDDRLWWWAPELLHTVDWLYGRDEQKLLDPWVYR